MKKFKFSRLEHEPRRSLTPTQAEQTTRESALRTQARTVKLEATLSTKREGDAQCQQFSWMDDKPTLSQTWTVDKPQSAICVQSVDAHMSCSSHSDAQFAAFFIDPRAK